jgi:hypothetical protein
MRNDDCDDFLSGFDFIAEVKGLRAPHAKYSSFFLPYPFFLSSLPLSPRSSILRGLPLPPLMHR